MFRGGGLEGKKKGGLRDKWSIQDQFPRVEPQNCFLFQPILHNWSNKHCGMYYPVWNCTHRRSLSGNQKNSP